MGTGNPLVHSFDEEGIDVTTLFFNPPIQDVDEYIAEYAAEFSDDEDYTPLSNDEAHQQISDGNYESFEQMFHVDGLRVHGWDNAERITELSAEFRGECLILATGDNIYVVVPSGCEHYHIGFGFVPRRSWNSFWEEAWDENAHKQEWYAKRNWDFDARMNLLADREYDKYIAKCNAEIKRIAANVAKEWGHKAFRKYFSVRAGAWMSTPINKTEFKRLALI